MYYREPAQPVYKTPEELQNFINEANRQHAREIALCRSLGVSANAPLGGLVNGYGTVPFPTD